MCLSPLPGVDSRLQKANTPGSWKNIDFLSSVLHHQQALLKEAAFISRSPQLEPLDPPSLISSSFFPLGRGRVHPSLIDSSHSFIKNFHLVLGELIDSPNLELISALVLVGNTFNGSLPQGSPSLPFFSLSHELSPQI